MYNGCFFTKNPSQALGKKGRKLLRMLIIPHCRPGSGNCQAANPPPRKFWVGPIQQQGPVLHKARTFAVTIAVSDLHSRSANLHATVGTTRDPPTAASSKAEPEWTRSPAASSHREQDRGATPTNGMLHTSLSLSTLFAALCKHVGLRAWRQRWPPTRLPKVKMPTLWQENRRQRLGREQHSCHEASSSWKLQHKKFIRWKTKLKAGLNASLELQCRETMEISRPQVGAASLWWRWQTASGGSIPRKFDSSTVDPLKGNGLGQKKSRETMEIRTQHLQSKLRSRQASRASSHACDVEKTSVISGKSAAQTACAGTLANASRRKRFSRVQPTSFIQN